MVQREVRSCLVVILASQGKLGANMRVIHEPMLIQAFITQAPVEALYVSVFVGLPGCVSFP